MCAPPFGPSRRTFATLTPYRGRRALRVTPCGSRSLAAAGASEKSGGQQLSHPRNVKLWRPPRPAAIGPACDVSRSTVTWGLGPLAARRSGIRRSRRRRLATGTGKGSAASQQAPPRAAFRAAARSGVFWLLSRQSYGTLFCSSSLSPRISALLFVPARAQQRLKRRLCRNPHAFAGGRPATTFSGWFAGGLRPRLS